MLAQRTRRWASIKPALLQRLVFTRYIDTHCVYGGQYTASATRQYHAESDPDPESRQLSPCPYSHPSRIEASQSIRTQSLTGSGSRALTTAQLLTDSTTLDGTRLFLSHGVF